jgi:hypothetical protein
VSTHRREPMFPLVAGKPTRACRKRLPTRFIDVLWLTFKEEDQRLDIAANDADLNRAFVLMVGCSSLLKATAASDQRGMPWEFLDSSDWLTEQTSSITRSGDTPDNRTTTCSTYRGRSSCAHRYRRNS